MIGSLLRYSLSNLWGRKTRSFLTILSILVGITAIFALISFGQGIQVYVQDMAQKQGTDKLIVQPKGFGAPGSSNIKFTKDDVDFIAKINGVDIVVGSPVEVVKIKFKDYKEKHVYMMGFPTDGEKKRLIQEVATITILNGRDLKKGDVLKATLGYNYMFPDKIFKKPLSTGDKITINDVEVEVVGFYEEVGNPSDDGNVYLTLDGVEKIFGRNDYDWILIRSSPDVDPAELSNKITERFRKHRNQKKGEEDFYVQTFEEAIKTFTSIIGIINGVLFLIAFISVVVASVNIMNTMYTSVIDSTREIGVMKAIGAKNNFILMVFMIESGILGTIGGIFGVILGFLIAKIGEFIAKMNGLAMLKPIFPVWLIVGCIIFSFIVGVGSGLLPSLQASKLNPVDALRYE